MIPVLKSPQAYRAYRISPDSTNRLAIVFDPTSAQYAEDLAVLRRE